MRSIQGFSKILLQDHSNDLDMDGKDFLERISKSGDRMSDIIEDLFALSKISRYDKFTIESVNLSLLVDEIIKNLQTLYPDKIIDCQVQENISANCDLKLIRIILENLLGNALKFSAVKSNPIIEFGTIDQDSKTVFFVRDNGVGFDMEYYDKLFAVFQRLYNIEKFPGSGIGLATVKRIIQKLNGKIWAEGAVNKGATFYFTINQK